MRIRKNNSDFSIRAIAGTEVVLLGMNAKKSATKGLLGFSIERLDHKTKTKKLLSNEPIQRFLWGDYTADPGKDYTYTLKPLYGTLDSYKAGAGVKVKVTTENPDDGIHGVYFNRGVAGSKRYSELYGKQRRFYLVDKFGRERFEDFIKPEEVPKNSAFKWLSRGLEEGMPKFIRQAEGSQYKLRAAVYEFTYAPVLEAFAECLESGVDVKRVRSAGRVVFRWKQCVQEFRRGKSCGRDKL